MRTGMIAMGLAAMVLAGAAAARETATPAVPAVAAGDAAQVIAGRRAAFLMSGALMGQIKGAIDRGDEVGKVGFAVRSIAAWAKALPGMFPAGSDAAPSEALPNVWSDRAGFEAKAPPMPRQRTSSRIWPRQATSPASRHNSRCWAAPATAATRPIASRSSVEAGQEPGLLLLQRLSSCAHRGQPEPGDPIGLAVEARDQPAALEPPEQGERAIDQDMTLAGEAVRRDDRAGFGMAAVDDAPALRQRMQDALFVFRDVQGSAFRWDATAQPRGGHAPGGARARRSP